MAAALDATTAVKLGEYLRSVRESAGATQDDTARRAGMSRSTLVRIENGRDGSLHPPNVKRMLDALDENLADHVDEIARLCGGEFADAVRGGGGIRARTSAEQPDLLVKIGEVLVPINIGAPFYWDGVPLEDELVFHVHGAIIDAITRALEDAGWRSSVRYDGTRRARREAPQLDGHAPGSVHSAS